MSDALERLQRRRERLNLGARADLPAEIISDAERAAARSGNPIDAEELKRVCALPVKRGFTKEEVDAFSKRLVQSEWYARGFRLRTGQCEAVYDFKQTGGGFFPIKVGQGKCLVAETEVLDLSGRRRRVDELGTFSVPSMTSEGRIEAAQADAFASGQKNCLRIRLADGRAVGLSEDHPVFTSEGWCRADGLVIGDLVAVARSVPEPQFVTRVSDDEVMFVAYMLANGGTAGASTRFTDDNLEMLRELRAVVTRLGGTFKQTGWSGKAQEVSLSGVRKVVKRWGMAFVKAVHKRVPATFYGLSARQLALFINRFWSSDGYINERKSSLEMVLGSEKLIDDLQALLTRFGVASRKRYKKATYYSTKYSERRYFDAWKLTISGRENVSAFFSHVGFFFGQEDKSARLLASVKGKGNTNVDVIPFGPTEFKQLCDELGFRGVGGAPELRGAGRPRTTLRLRLGVTQGQLVGRETFASWVRESGYSGQFSWLATSDLRWERVKSIELLGLREVYDLSVPGNESFVGNGIVLHNSATAIMCADLFFKRTQGRGKALLLLPSQLYLEMVKYHIPWARRRLAIGIPYYGLVGKSAQKRFDLAKSDYRGLYIMGYSQLSGRDADHILRAMDPDLVICDEAWYLHNKSSARTKRLFRWIEWRESTKKGKPKGVALTGTITQKSILEYWHVLAWCLDTQAPVPLLQGLVRDWSLVLDTDAFMRAELPEKHRKMISPIVSWARRHFPKEAAAGRLMSNVAGFRCAYRLRLTSAPGVVSSGEEDLGTTLEIANRPVAGHEKAPGWAKIEALIKQVREDWKTPAGDLIEFAIHKWKWQFELSAGFYNEQVWPDAQDLANRRGVALNQAQWMIDTAKQHKKLKSEYSGELREWIEKKGRPGLDTPWLIGGSFLRHGAKEVGDADLYELWRDMKNLEFKGIDRVPLNRAVKVCSYKVDAAVEWVKNEVPQGEGALIWVWNIALGRWVTETLRKHGIPALYAGAGQGKMFLDPGNHKRVIVTRIKSHGEGRNLQAWGNQMVLQWPRSPVWAQQMLGRCHRPGQTRDHLVVRTVNTTLFDRENYSACLNDATYVQATTGDSQKIITAQYDPFPIYFTSQALRERGFADVKLLTDEQRQMLEERYGGGVKRQERDA